MSCEHFVASNNGNPEVPNGLRIGTCDITDDSCWIVRGQTGKCPIAMDFENFNLQIEQMIEENLRQVRV
jgi:hypothetical protein